MTIFSSHFLPNAKFTGFGHHIFEIISKIIDLDVQIFDFSLEKCKKQLKGQILDFWNDFKNMDFQVLDFWNMVKHVEVQIWFF